MGEKEETKKEAVAEKKDEGGREPNGAAAVKEEEPAAAVVLKLDLHCEGCAKKVRRSIRHLEGVKEVKTEWETGKVTVKGEVDPILLHHTVANKTKKHVAILSPPPKADVAATATATGGDKKAVEIKEEKKPEAEAKATTAVMKIRLHCEGCAHKIKKIIKATKGVENVTIDTEKDLVTVNGTMDVAELTSYLTKKLKRRVEVTPPPPKPDGGGEEKKAAEEKSDVNKEEKETTGGGEGEMKKEERGGGEAAPAPPDVSRMAYGGYHPNTYYYATPPMYNQSYHNQDYGIMTAPPYWRVAPPTPPPAYINAPPEHMFSEEDPNACSLM